ncbi:MAG: DUF3160 domain-containing protein [Deltaproteobacteria bacterium]|nr:DUF3160 domain-containing protein [Deltaproteobacteria bacterium]
MEAAPPEDPASDEGWLNHKRKPRTSDTCEVADNNLARAEREILASKNAAAPAPRQAWDRVSNPQYLDRILERVHVNRSELGMLRRNGFVVLAGRPLDSYATAYHDVFQTELPVYVTADSIFHAVFASNDTVIATVEARTLAPALHKALLAMHCALPSMAGSYPAETAQDLDLYLSVALTLLLGEPEVHGFLGTDEQAKSLVDLATAAEGMSQVELFGRPRMIDFSQFRPRGHYGDGAGYASPNAFVSDVPGATLTTYFRASMWLSRLEFNLVSRSCRSSHPDAAVDPRETPREAVLALALADLAARTGASANIERLNRAWSLFAGRREDVSLRQLNELRAKAGITDLRQAGVDARLRAAIGSSFRRTARLHFMPQGSNELPAIATMLGPRVVDDAAISRRLVHDELPGRMMVHAADIAYVLGHDRAKSMLADDRKEFPGLGGQLDKARSEMMESSRRGEGMYGAWLGAILRAAEPPKGTVPSFMDGPAFQDLRMNTAITAFGQLRHNYVLVAGQGYDAYGCEIPDGYVEPALGVYEGLSEYTQRAKAALAELDPADASGAGVYFQRLGQVLKVLRAIAADELAGKALSEPQKRWLAMVAEHIPAHNVDTGGPPQYTGWYFDLFLHRDNDSKGTGAFIADWYTSTNLQKVAYIGASPPRLGLFVVDAGGQPRVMAGPVARGWEHVGSTSRRLDDSDAAKLSISSAPWESSYTARAVAEPPLSLRMMDDGKGKFEVVAKSTRALGPVTVELLNHHGAPTASRTQSVGAAEVRFTFSIPVRKSTAGSPMEGFGWHAPSVEGLHVKIGEFDLVRGASEYRPLQDFAIGEMRKAEQEGQEPAEL